MGVRTEVAIYVIFWLVVYSILEYTTQQPKPSNEIDQTWVFYDSLTSTTDTLHITIDTTKYNEKQYIETYTYCYKKWLQKVRQQPKQILL